MMEVAERRNKTLPYHPGLDTYDPKAVDEKELLGVECKEVPIWIGYMSIPNS